MGSFSWLSVTNLNKSCLEYRPAIVLIPKKFGGGFLRTDEFAFGDVGNKDVYALLAQWNEPDQCLGKYNDNGEFDDNDRKIGIKIGCYDKDSYNLDYPLKIIATSNKTTSKKYEDFEIFSPACPGQGWYHPDRKTGKELKEYYNKFKYPKYDIHKNE